SHGYDEVVYIPMTSGLSSSCQTALILAADYDGRVQVVDNHQISVPLKNSVRDALALAEAGLPACEIKARLEEVGMDSLIYIGVDTLEYLKRGGRISPSIAMVGGLLSIKPVVAVRDGEVVLLGKARGSKNGNNLLVQTIEKTSGVDFSRPYRLGYTGLDDGLLQKYVADSAKLWQEHVDELPVSTVGCAIGTHVGPGAIAVAFFQKS
ncbi:MAG: DegV family protein, partial [Oscillospiraceae bacterium]|nr:DegV family protein [Oscillospiraceae bacterium]